MTHLNQAQLFIFGWRAKKEQRKSKTLLVAAS